MYRDYQYDDQGSDIEDYQVALPSNTYRDIHQSLQQNQFTRNIYQNVTFFDYSPRATYHGPKRDYSHYLDDKTKVFTRDIVLIWQHMRPEQYPPLFKERTKIIIFRSTGINHEIDNFEESMRGKKHKMWIRNLQLQDAQTIFSN